MDNNDIVIEIEPTANTTPSSRLPRSQSHDSDAEESSWSVPLHVALRRNDWDATKEILERVPESINGPVGPNDQTPLVYALQEEKDMRIIEYLINRTTPPEKLVYSQDEINWSDRNMSAIHYAAITSNFTAAKLLIEKYPPMLNTRDRSKKAAIYTALNFGKSEMAIYLLKLALTHLQDLPEFEQTCKMDLEFAIKKRNYDFAYILIQHFPKLALHDSPWKVLIEECIDLPCRRRLNMLQSIIYPWIHMDDETVLKSITRQWENEIHPPKKHKQYRPVVFTILFSGEYTLSQMIRLLIANAWRSRLHKIQKRIRKMLVSPIKTVRLLKLKHQQALKLVARSGQEMCKLHHEESPNIVRLVYCSAVHNGASDIVEVILHWFYEAIEYKDDDGNNALQFAVSHRDEKIVHVVHKKFEYLTNDIITSITSSLDNKKNNLLHLAAKKARRNRLNTSSRKVLQLQREFQWYKEMEKMLPSHLKFQKNINDQVPLELFDEEHNDMLKSESEWLTSMSNSCMVAGSLIAAVVFAAAITLPGGNNEDDGFPKFSKQIAFNIFAFSDAGALVFSLTTVVTFLSIFTTRFSVESFQYDLPNRLIIGLISLLFSVCFLMIAFCTTGYLLFTHIYNWIIYPTVVVSFVPVFFFGYLQLPSLINIIQATYGRNIFENDNVTVLGKN